MAQFYQLSTGQLPSALLGSDFQQVSGNVLINVPSIDSQIYLSSAGRPISSSSILLINFIAGLFFLSNKYKVFNKSYLSAIVIGSFISIILTGTRGWIIAFGIILILYYVFHKQEL